MTQLAIHGVESEAELAFAGLTEVLRPVMDQVNRLPTPQAEALRSALALNAEPANPLAVRVALLTLLASLSEAAPVLVTVDDAQWVDESSMEALAFSVRRLSAERVVVLATARGESAIALTNDLAEQLVLDALSDDDALELLSDRGLTGDSAARLLRVGAGNPLALLELPDVVGPAPMDEGVAPPPVGPRVRQAFRDQLDRLPATSRMAVAVVAADGGADLGELLAAFADLGLEADSLQPAEHGGLVSIAGRGVQLRHPLLRSVAYHDLSAPERRRVHAALAAALHRPADVERRTWHRAAAAFGPDEDVALSLETVAAVAERRGALSTMAHGLARAASLSENDDSRARRLLLSADAWLAAGHWGLALDQLDQARSCAVDPALRADIAASSGQLEAYRAGPQAGTQILVDAAEAIAEADPGRATRLLTYAVNVSVFAAEFDRAVDLATRAVACGDRAGGLHLISGAMARVEAGLMVGDPTVTETLAPLRMLAEGLIDSDLADAEHVFGLVVLAELVLEEWDRAEWLLEVMVRRARNTGRLFLLAFALALRADVEFRRGRWSEAYTTVSTEVWENPLGLPGVGAWLWAVQARVEAGLGLDEEAEANGLAALAAATETGTAAMGAWAGASLGFLELGRGRPQAAVVYLERVAQILDAGNMREPGLLWWAADLVEAYWRVGDIGAARRRLEVLQAQATGTGRVWALATAARCLGLLAASTAEAEDAFAEALRWHHQIDAPFERARTLLRQGERRRQFGRSDAGALLREAQAEFDRIGARNWSAQAQRLLGGSPAGSVAASLTKQERQVAALVGQGATNREAADQLFLSPRTIDFHLSNIYKKLNVRSRTELAVHLAAQPPI